MSRTSFENVPTPVETVARRFALWAVVCGISAAPSFFWAYGEYSRPAMVCGVALFVVAYTALTSTAAFRRFHARPFVRRTLYIGYGTRVTLSVLFPVGMGLDMIPGMFSLQVVTRAGLLPTTFEGTLATTIVQGALLNAIVFVFMSIVYALQRAFAKPPAPDDSRRGFAVMPLPVTPEAAHPADARR